MVAMKQRRAKFTPRRRETVIICIYEEVGLGMGLDTVIVNIAVVGRCFGRTK